MCATVRAITATRRLAVHDIPIRLSWHHGHGYARYDGVEVALQFRPKLPTHPDLSEIDFSPNIIATVRDGCNREEELTGDECSYLLALLKSMAALARSVI